MRSPAPNLLEHVRRGDRDARRALFEELAPRVLRWCAHLGGSSVDPEDAAHDVLVTAMTRLSSLREPDRFESWLFGITRRVLAAHRRSAWVRRWVPGLSVDPADPREGPAAQYERGEQAARVRLVLDGLPPELREVIVLCDMEERTDAAVAALLDIPVGTLKSRLRRARARFEQAARRTAVSPQFPAARAGGER